MGRANRDRRNPTKQLPRNGDDWDLGNHTHAASVQAAQADDSIDAVPEIEFHAGKRPHEMTTAELLAAIDLVQLAANAVDTREWRWVKRLCAEFDDRRKRLMLAEIADIRQVLSPETMREIQAKIDREQA